MNSDDHTGYPFAGEGGIRPAVVSERDPFEVLDDLMAVIEKLCPKWPSRGTFADSREMLL